MSAAKDPKAKWDKFYATLEAKRAAKEAAKAEASKADAKKPERTA